MKRDPTQTQQQKHLIGAGFSRAATTYDQIGPPLFASFGQRLVELAQLPERGSVLDVAAGRGATLCMPAKKSGGQRSGRMACGRHFLRQRF
jgi:ubiquinone/menaquinone biosynthesis C-methylase UbiE